ncbi:Alpha/Beta hydrolase protein [Pterulicium gracile]|uniref:Alpha/Beta hydrolase protein n=1 Tax=Pterulicium gracile TaxID=1884261 RepID=A0A5C3Q745_9AGAR|nr:Alpha/Beta hydrolase protein [Pterula gracilis]
MMTSPTPLVLPRPGSTYPSLDPIPAPTESEFTAEFGTLLPPVQYLSTPHGRAAYYLFPRSEPDSSSPVPAPGAPTRALLIHGVQTPALGLVPFTTALRAQFPHTTSFALLDLWGHGLSDTSVVPHTTDLFAGLVDAVLKELGWKDDSTGVAIIGYSFGAVVSMEWLASHSSTGPAVHSLTLVAPAGLLKRSWFDEQQRGWLSTACSPTDESTAAFFVLRTLEGGTWPPVLPTDWQERVGRGEVVASAVKEWQWRVHKGHEASVVGVFRDGGVFENQALYMRAGATGVKPLVVLGELDEMSTEEEIRELGFEKIFVVKGAGHDVVRARAEEVAGRIAEFWRTI